MGAESSFSPQDYPLQMVRSPVLDHHTIARDGFNCDAKKNHYSQLLEAPSRPGSGYPTLSGLQRLLKTFRKAEHEQEEPKIVGLSIVIENSWNNYSCCKRQSKSVSGDSIGSSAKITSFSKSKPQIVNKLMVAAQCNTNGGSCKYRNPVLLCPASVVYSNVVASTPLPAIYFLDACYLCKRSLGPGQDIYMYRGDRAFCSVECRLKQMAMDEQREKIASAALKRPVKTSSPRDRRSEKNRTLVVPGRGLATAA